MIDYGRLPPAQAGSDYHLDRISWRRWYDSVKTVLPPRPLTGAGLGSVAIGFGNGQVREGATQPATAFRLMSRLRTEWVSAPMET